MTRKLQRFSSSKLRSSKRGQPQFHILLLPIKRKQYLTITLCDLTQQHCLPHSIASLVWL